MFANTQMMGMSLGFPDVCLTPTPAPAERCRTRILGGWC